MDDDESKLRRMLSENSEGIFTEGFPYLSKSICGFIAWIRFSCNQSGLIHDKANRGEPLSGRQHHRNRQQSSLRAKVDFPFRIIKRLWGAAVMADGLGERFVFHGWLSCTFADGIGGIFPFLSCSRAGCRDVTGGGWFGFMAPGAGRGSMMGSFVIRLLGVGPATSRPANALPYGHRKSMIYRWFHLPALEQFAE